MTISQQLFCFGFGYTAKALGRRLAEDRWRITGTTRLSDKADAIRAENAEPVLWDSAFDPAWLDDAAAILISTPPGEDGCPAFKAASGAIAERRQHIKWVGYLSTNGVYGDHDGAWVDETSELRATSARGRRRIAAENAWRRLAADHNLPLIVFRLPGIYGPGRSAFDAIRARTAKRIYKEGQVFSRMHVDDIASALAASLNLPRRHDVYNLADDEPAPPQNVITYACGLSGAPPPPLIPISDADLSPMAKSFYADNKRVSNIRMKQALNIQLAYPTYREGLEAILKTEKV